MWGRMQRPMLSGTYECSLDNRFRLAIPAKFRDSFDGGAAIAWWIDECVVCVPRTAWPEIVAQTFGELSVLDPKQRQLRRYLLAGTYEQDGLDKQGRIVVPEKLRSWAGIDQKVTVVGAGDYLELWNPARLDDSFEALRREGVSTLAERLNDRGA